MAYLFSGAVGWFEAEEIAGVAGERGEVGDVLLIVEDGFNCVVAGLKEGEVMVLVCGCVFVCECM